MVCAKTVERTNSCYSILPEQKQKQKPKAKVVSRGGWNAIKRSTGDGWKKERGEKEEKKEEKISV